MTTRTLTIDAGNTRIKWAVMNASGAIIETGACQHAALEAFRFPQADSVIISNVAGENIQTRLMHLMQSHQHVHTITSQPSACGVVNHYDSSKNLGTDRWAALIAAWQLEQKTCIVVNAGTAVTIDALVAKENQGHFIGGVIMPGLDLMQQSLGLHTAQLPKWQHEHNQEKIDLISTQTRAGILSGAVFAVVGCIMQMVDRIQTLGDANPVILLSGGNATMIKAYLSMDVKVNVKIEELLVLRGLMVINQYLQRDPS